MSVTGEVWTVRRLLEWTAGFFARKQVDSPRLAAEQLLSHVMGVPRIRLYTDYDRVLDETVLTRYRELVRRAGEQEPIEYLTGISHFFGLELAVSREVLIPRPDTETLVEHVLQTVRFESHLTAPRVLDLCTGSGCIALAIAARLTSATVLAVDISPAALRVARSNLERLKLTQRVQLAEGDLFAALRDVVDAAPFDIITANPPYIRSDLIPKLDRSVRDYEPHVALDGGPDGLEFHRRILAELPTRLAPGGRAFLEIAYDQGERALAAASAVTGLAGATVLRDHAANDRVLTVLRPRG
ncbi:MAG TPA: peptide chain release factor N(5)-glutamine methyltransferase [Tepidisphaeraceae bacterium]|nr:peptide chain release factor N(5)-glutamine methyltransferase [Tepidisphaeraceae bacterium]